MDYARQYNLRPIVARFPKTFLLGVTLLGLPLYLIFGIGHGLKEGIREAFSAFHSDRNTLLSYIGSVEGRKPFWVWAFSLPGLFLLGFVVLYFLSGLWR